MTPRTPTLATVAKGARPVFAKEPEVDRVTAMVMALASEVAVLRERLDTVETIAEAKGVMLRDEIEGFVPSKEHEAEREAWRHDFLDRVLYILKVEAAQAADAASAREGEA